MDKNESTTFKRLSSRYLYDKISNGRSFLLFGPRQTGKSTLLERIFDQLPSNHQIRFYFQLPSQRLEIQSDPELILRQVEALQNSTPAVKQPIFVFIDEIQKAPEVLDVLQFLIDKKKIILAACGSSTRRMRTLGANWLPGRVDLEWLYPLTWEESEVTRSSEYLEKSLLFGSLPGIWAIESEEERSQSLAQYTHLYLDEEIRMEAQIRNLPKFSKFLQLAALESGTAPNFSKIGTQVEVSHTTIANYYQILEDTLIVHRVDAYGSSRTQVLRSPRYYFFDRGVRNSAAKIGQSRGILNLQRGVLFEHFIILEIIAKLGALPGEKPKIYYWRNKKGEEVDVVIELPNAIEGKKRVIALEIKATRKPLQDDFRGLDAFHAQYSCHSSFLVCQIDRAQKFGPHLAISWQDLHKQMSL